MNKKLGEEGDLSFLTKFSNLTEQTYLQQIDKDEANMKLGLQLLESNINALRSQIELEKSERDRNFQNLVAIIGGGAAVINTFNLKADVEGKQCKAIIKSLPISNNDSVINYCDNFFFNQLLISIILLIFAAIFALIFKSLFKKFMR